MRRRSRPPRDSRSPISTAEAPSAPETAVDGAYLLHRWVLRLFLGGLVLGLGMAALAGYLEVPVHPLIALAVTITVIALPALALSGYVVVCFGLAIVALWKVLRTNWRMRA
jgi:hypothetical protein